MNRIDRLFAITLLLQAKGRVRAKDLAAWFEVSQRTIYRDIAALSESDVPVRLWRTQREAVHGTASCRKAP